MAPEKKLCGGGTEGYQKSPKNAKKDWVLHFFPFEQRGGGGVSKSSGEGSSEGGNIPPSVMPLPKWDSPQKDPGEGQSIANWLCSLNFLLGGLRWGFLVRSAKKRVLTFLMNLCCRSWNLLFLLKVGALLLLDKYNLFHLSRWVLFQLPPPDYQLINCNRILDKLRVL